MKKYIGSVSLDIVKKRSMERIRGEQQTLVSEKIIKWEDKKQSLRRTRKL